MGTEKIWTRKSETGRFENAVEARYQQLKREIDTAGQTAFSNGKDGKLASRRALSRAALAEGIFAKLYETIGPGQKAMVSREVAYRLSKEVYENEIERITQSEEYQNEQFYADSRTEILEDQEKIHATLPAHKRVARLMHKLRALEVHFMKEIVQ